jgi:hypothetical protein
LDGRALQRRQWRERVAASAQEEPNLLLLLPQAGEAVALLRTSPGSYALLTLVDPGLPTAREAVVARKPTGGYVFLRNSPSGAYQAIRSSALEDEVLVVRTLMDTAVLLIKKHEDGYANVTDYSRVDAGAVALLADAPAGQNMLVVVVNTDGSSGGGAGTFTLLRQKQGTVFEPFPHRPAPPPVELTLRLKNNLLVPLQRVSDGSYIRVAAEPRSPRVPIPESLDLPATHFRELLTKQAALDRQQEVLVTVLQQGHTDDTYKVIERSNGGLYQVAPTISQDVLDMGIETADGGRMHLMRAEDGYARVHPNGSIDIPDELPVGDESYMEVSTTTATDGHKVTLVRSRDGGYAVLRQEPDGLYLRPDTGEEYLTREDLMSLARRSSAPSLKSSRAGTPVSNARPALPAMVHPRHPGRASVTAPELLAMASGQAASIAPAGPVAAVAPFPLQEPRAASAAASPSRATAPKPAPVGGGPLRLQGNALPVVLEDEERSAPLSARSSKGSAGQPASFRTAPSTRESMGYIDVAEEATNGLSSRRSTAIVVAPRTVATAPVSWEASVAVLKDAGLMAGSHFWREVSATEFQLLVVFARQVYVVPIRLEPRAGEAPVRLVASATGQTVFHCATLADLAQRFALDTTGLPCPLGMNLTPR